MKYIKYILLIILFIFTINETFAQVTIGSDVEPADFSLVQVEGDNGGVRLPRMTSTDMIDLKTTLLASSESTGLVVYNITDNRLEFWDGSDWVSLTSTNIAGSNGITNVTSPNTGIELGATGTGENLSKATNIDLKDFELKFNHTSATASQFAVNATKIKNSEIDIIPTGTFSINTNALSTNAATRSVNMVAEKISVNNDLLSAGASTTPGIGVRGQLKYPHSTANAGYLLVSDASGNASWGAVRPMGAIETGEINSNTDFGSNTNITTRNLVLSPGQWMIFAKYTGRRAGTASPMFHWLELQYSTTPTVSSSWSAIGRGGCNPEMVSSGNVYSTPSYITMVDINVTTNYRIVAMTTMTGTNTCVQDFGGAYFYAVRLDVPSNP